FGLVWLPLLLQDFQSRGRGKCADIPDHHAVRSDQRPDLAGALTLETIPPLAVRDARGRRPLLPPFVPRGEDDVHLGERFALEGYDAFDLGELWPSSAAAQTDESAQDQRCEHTTSVSHDDGPLDDRASQSGSCGSGALEPSGPRALVRAAAACLSCG